MSFNARQVPQVGSPGVADRQALPLALGSELIDRAAQCGIDQTLLEDAALWLDKRSPLDGGYVLRASHGLERRLEGKGFTPGYALRIASVSFLIDDAGQVLAIDARNKAPSMSTRWEKAVAANRALTWRRGH